MPSRQPTTHQRETPRGLLTRLRRDVRGNTLAMMAIFLVPLTGLVGSAVDMSRLYVVKARLQQACDAGVLAGRKSLIDSNATTLDANAAAQAQSFFANNFKKDTGATPGYMNSTAVSFTPAKTADNQVSGTATATVPMTIAKIIGTTQVTLNVACEARYDVADTDVMFVLDTTGSMACTPSDPDSCGQGTVQYTKPDGTTSYYIQEKSGSRISALRAAVLSFYDTVAANADPSTHVRYGFVPYTSTVNAGAAITSLSPSYMVSTWNYDTRQVVGDAANGSASNAQSRPVTLASCTAQATGRSPATGYSANGTAQTVSSSWSSSNGGTCTVTTQPLKPLWRYKTWPTDVSQYVTGATVTDPSKITGATSKWQGCIEERDTIVASTFDQNNLPPDLDPDLVPTNDNTRWRPMWPDIIYYRQNYTSVDDGGNIAPPYGDSNTYFWFSNPGYSYLPGGYLTCGKAVQRLATLSRSDVSAYVNAPDFVPWGGTYHDTGMIWGTRMLSPNGIFGADTAAWPGRNPPNRYIVFMTDGHMSTSQYIYGMYGWENYAQRTTGGNFANGDAYHNARFQAECQAAKNRNITVFVVSLASTLDSSLVSCASPGQAYYASDSATLTAAFQNIAKQVALLRISR